jgi:ABC-type bacteriocin/lantibiotic exporter with double-glycine peptidase domain
MNLIPQINGRRMLVPEVVQTSEMDCGPASLKAMLGGYGISVNYGRLREACQTSVDGTSIDTLEELAIQLGLRAEQVMLPVDHLLLEEADALPAIVVVRQPKGLTHFLIIWSTHGPFVQVMDPATGRRWVTRKNLLQELYIHTFPVPPQAWREWAGTDGFIRPLQSRLELLEINSDRMARLVQTAIDDSTWFGLAALDAAVRWVNMLVQSRGLEKGEESARTLEHIFSAVCSHPDEAGDRVPTAFWSVQPGTEENSLNLVGAVLVRVDGLQDVPMAFADGAQPPAQEEAPPEYQPLPPEVVAALSENPGRPEFEVLKYIRQDGFLTPLTLAIALGLATAGVVFQALMLQGLLQLSRISGLVGQQQTTATTILLVFTAALMLLFLPINTVMMRIGRRLETRFRIDFLEKIPRLGDRYFYSRLVSDMAQRAYSLRQIRILPQVAINFLRLGFQFIFTSIGVIVLLPNSAPLALLSAAAAIIVPIFSHPALVENDMRLRTHLGGLSRFYLDSLMGLIPIRTHSAERSVRREHEMLLTEWVQAGLNLYRTTWIVQGLSTLVSYAFTIWILFHHISTNQLDESLLLLFYWALNLPLLGKSLAEIARQYPSQRNIIMRLLEPLTAPDETDTPIITNREQAAPSPDQTLTQTNGPLGIRMQNVKVQAGGQTILEDINLEISPGEHISIVGSSGAGKTSLVGLLLGWHRPVNGHIWIDGLPLKGHLLEEVRSLTAWVDPAIQIWNRTLFENLTYGNPDPNQAVHNLPVDEADLYELLSTLPDGMQTILGESGGLVSGGEGQRVRLGRAMYRSGTRLVILDEPFRGLDREKRRKLLKRALEYWKDSTLICVTHDVGETLPFKRVVVIEDSRIIEDDSPKKLRAKPDSRYSSLLKSEEDVRTGLWESANWRRLWLADGKLAENTESSSRQTSKEKPAKDA